VSLFSYLVYIHLHYLKLFLLNLCASASIYLCVLVLCVEGLHQVWFELELIEGFYLYCWFAA
jgi:hypothetical protein